MTAEIKTQAQPGCIWLCTHCQNTADDRCSNDPNWTAICRQRAIHGYKSNERFVLVPHPAMPEFE